MRYHAHAADARRAGVLPWTIAGLCLGYASLYFMACTAITPRAVCITGPLIFGSSVGLGIGVVRHCLVRGFRASLRLFFELTASFAIVAALSHVYLDAVRVNVLVEHQLSCGFQLRLLGACIESFAHRYGSFPPAYLSDAQGRKMHSWRLLMLPALERNDVYTAYDFFSPWNSPANLSLGRLVSELYACPSDRPTDPTAGHANYVAITGPDAIWGAAWDPSFHQANRNLSSILLAVERVAAVPPGGPIAPLEPRDMDLRDLLPGSDTKFGAAFSHHPGGFHVLFADGRVERISTDVPDDLRQLVEGHRAAVKTYRKETRMLTPLPWNPP